MIYRVVIKSSHGTPVFRGQGLLSQVRTIQVGHLHVQVTRTVLGLVQIPDVFRSWIAIYSVLVCVPRTSVPCTHLTFLVIAPAPALELYFKKFKLQIFHECSIHLIILLSFHKLEPSQNHLGSPWIHQEPPESTLKHKFFGKYSSKGHSISKCLLGVLNSPKKTNENNST